MVGRQQVEQMRLAAVVVVPEQQAPQKMAVTGVHRLFLVRLLLMAAAEAVQIYRLPPELAAPEAVAQETLEAALIPAQQAPLILAEAAAVAGMVRQAVPAS